MLTYTWKVNQAWGKYNKKNSKEIRYLAQKLDLLPKIIRLAWSQKQVLQTTILDYWKMLKK